MYHHFPHFFSFQVLTTRSNRELKAALDYYHHLNGKSFLEVIQGKAYQNCAKLVKTICECKRDEGKEGFDQVRPFFFFLLFFLLSLSVCCW